MHTDDGSGPTRDELVAMGYEKRDINLKGVTKVILYLFSFAAFSWVSAYFVLQGVRVGPLNINGLGGEYTKNKVPGEDVPRKLPALPNPLLQNNVTAKSDMMEMRQQEEFFLNRAHRNGPNSAIVAIPVEDAKNLLLSKGVAVGASMPAQSAGNQSGQVRETPAGANGGLSPNGTPTVTAPQSAGR